MKVLKFSEFINEATVPVKKQKTALEKDLTEIEKDEKERYAEIEADELKRQRHMWEKGERQSRPFKREFNSGQKPPVLHFKDTAPAENKRTAIRDSEKIKEIEKEEALRIRKLFQKQLEEEQEMIAKGDKDSYKSYFPKIKRAERREQSTSNQSISNNTTYGGIPENPMSIHDFNIMVRNGEIKKVTTTSIRPDFYWTYKNGNRVGFKIIR